jgi:ornithine cyclodeaminase/alanine dehydrogenase-like protein (mu-crystallin family)
VRFLDADAVTALRPAAAVRAIRAALHDGLDPAADPPRAGVELSAGQVLFMPSEIPMAAGVKVVTVAPGNPARGLPRVQGGYLLFDRETLALRAVLDGTALTTVRTPAVSVAAVLDLLPERPVRIAVIGAGPQARSHVATLAAVRPLDRVSYLVRTPAGTPLRAVLLGSAEAEEALATADVVGMRDLCPIAGVRLGGAGQRCHRHCRRLARA